MPYYLYNVGTDAGGKNARNNTAILFDCYRAILESFRTFADTMGLGCEMRKRLDMQELGTDFGKKHFVTKNYSSTEDELAKNDEIQEENGFNNNDNTAKEVKTDEE